MRGFLPKILQIVDNTIFNADNLRNLWGRVHTRAGRAQRAQQAHQLGDALYPLRRYEFFVRGVHRGRESYVFLAFLWPPVRSLPGFLGLMWVER